MSDAANTLASMLTNPEERKNAVAYMDSVLNSLGEKRLNVLQIQAACIGGLIELNGNLQNLKLKSVNLRQSLNSILESILLCPDFQNTKNCILDYVQKLSDKLNKQTNSSLPRELSGIYKCISEIITRNRLVLPPLQNNFICTPII